DDTGGAEQGVLAQIHRRGAGMCVLAGYRDLVPAHALHAGYDADHLLLVLEDRPLLDMELEHRLELVRAGLLAAAIADALQLVEKGDAVAVSALIGILRREHAGKHARSEHGGGVARALLIGPVDDLDGCIGLVALLVQRAHGLERTEHAEHAIELAAG